MIYEPFVFDNPDGLAIGWLDTDKWTNVLFWCLMDVFGLAFEYFHEWRDADLWSVAYPWIYYPGLEEIYFPNQWAERAALS